MPLQPSPESSAFTSPAGSDAPRATTTATASEFGRTVLVIVLAMISIAAIDARLAKSDRTETRKHAANLYHDGSVLLRAGNPAAAADKFADAVAANRSRPEYQLGLAEALLAQDKINQAKEHVQSVLDQAETDGPANLLMARILVRQNQVEPAKSYYHRAIFGRWPDDSAPMRTAARLELIDFLARHDAREELLAELLTIRATSSITPELERKLGHLFIVAGSPAQGADIFRSLLEENSEDADAYRGMGEAALALGNFQTAKADLTIAARLAPGDSAAQSLLMVADSVLGLDPLARGVDVRERLERARRLLSLTLDATTRCDNASETRFADSARTVLTTQTPRPTDDAVESTVSLAAAIWRTIDPGCRRDRSITDKALGFIQGKLAD